MTDPDTNLIGDTDATHWAERWRYHYEKDGLNASTLEEAEATMVTWFAGAIETGRLAGIQLGEASPHIHPYAEVCTEACPGYAAVTAEKQASRPEYIAFFDQYNEWTHQAALGWPQNGQWCPRHWAPGAHGYNGIGAAVALMEAFASSDLCERFAPTPEGLNRAMNRIVKEFGAICCALGEQEVYRIWQDWPAEARRPGQIDPA